LIKSFMRLQQFEFGFNPDNLLTMRVQLPGSKYKNGKQVVGFYQQLLERMEALPGVQSVARFRLCSSPTHRLDKFLHRRATRAVGVEAIEVPLDSISPSYFKVMGIPLLRGREFDNATSRERHRWSSSTIPSRGASFRVRIQ